MRRRRLPTVEAKLPPVVVVLCCPPPPLLLLLLSPWRPRESMNSDVMLELLARTVKGCVEVCV